MSNMAALIANDLPGPAGSEIGCDRRGRDVLATGPHAVPVFWVSLFEERHLVTFEAEGEDEDGDEMTLTIPSLVAEIEDAKRLLRERRETVIAAFPEFQPTWDQFARVIERLRTAYVKVDVQELWDIATAVAEDFASDLRAAIRWFESRDGADFDRLLSVASISGYDAPKRSFARRDDEVPRAFHLRGYASRKSRWDDQADI